MNGYPAGSAMPAAALSNAFSAVSPLVGGSTGLPSPANPRRPSIPYAASQLGGLGLTGAGSPAVAQGLTAQQQALLQRAQQPSRQTPSSAPPFFPSDGGPAPKVPVHRAYSRIRDTEPGEPFPSISPADQARVKQWIERDAAHEEAVVEARQGMRSEVNSMMEEMLREQDWLGPIEAQPRGKFRLRFPQDKALEEAKGKKGQLRQPAAPLKAQLRADAAKPECLIPIRLDLEHEVYKLRDTFTWNLRESTITPELFAQHLLADLRFPQEPLLKQIVASLKKQIADAQLGAEYTGFVDPALGAARDESREWFEERAAKRRRVEEAAEMSLEEEEEGGEEALPLASFGVQTDATDELRVLIKLDITLDTVQLVDKFEWNISDPHNSPEEFAETFATELGLTGEFATAIAHAIREQVEVYTKSLCLLGYSKGGFIADDELRRDFLPPLVDPFRADTADEFTPALTQLNRDDVDRNEKEHDRESRRKRRQTKGRGVVLPDREFVRTNRTLVPRSLPGLVSFEIDIKGHKSYHLPELNEPFPIVGKAVPPKPADLETSDANPLQLLPAKDKGGAAGALAAAAAANRFKRGAGDVAGDALARGAMASRKKPPVIHANPEELGLHEHIIDGHWFCANCGCPEHIAVGRRKGPTGKDSLCGLCGKYFHRYKRQRPCVYTRDNDTHARFRAEEEAKGKSKRPRKAAASALAAEDAAMRSAKSSGNATPASQAMSPASSAHDPDDHDDSDASSTGSPRKRRTGFYGSPDTPFVHLDSGDSDEEGSEGEGSPPPARQATPPPPPPPPVAQPTQLPGSGAPQPLPWMVAAADELRAKQVDDRFEIIPRPRPNESAPQEWRIRCLDCPGKLYLLGPGTTLDGFLVHLKNRVHRANVGARLQKEQQQ
ncbi:hypothetical protein JCM10207_002277 [Rhodosporidiobolus poonsookiae]